ncbi:hypothetical protein AAFG07_06195 [Bradyrhizobium sp. B097]|uniref:hypothetical protein n=1 Tax=Bradyrhizobium sp. B097 TaxID=3140244 RepID=UPI0031832D3E
MAVETKPVADNHCQTASNPNGGSQGRSNERHCTACARDTVASLSRGTSATTVTIGAPVRKATSMRTTARDAASPADEERNDASVIRSMYSVSFETQSASQTLAYNSMGLKFIFRRLTPMPF